MHDEEVEVIASQLEVMSPYTKLYKGPNWKITEKEIDLLARHGWSIAVQEKIDRPIKQWPLTDERAFHGHCWIQSDWEKLYKILEQNKQVQFKFIEETI